MNSVAQSTGLTPTELGEYLRAIRQAAPDDLVKQAFADALAYRREQQPVLKLEIDMQQAQIEMTPSAVAAILRMAEAGPLPREALMLEPEDLVCHLVERYGFTPSRKFAEQVRLAMRLQAERMTLLERLVKIDAELIAVDEGTQVYTRDPLPVFEAPPLKPVRGA